VQPVADRPGIAMTGTPEQPTGLFASLRTLAHDVLDLLATRSDLAALELGETRDLLLRSVVLGVVAAVLALAALVAFTLWIAVLFWDGPRALAVGLLTAAYAAGVAIAIVAIRRGVTAAGPVLGQTRAVLRKDYEALRGPRAGPAVAQNPPVDVPPAAPGARSDATSGSRSDAAH